MVQKTLNFSLTLYDLVKLFNIQLSCIMNTGNSSLQGPPKKEQNIIVFHP